MKIVIIEEELLVAENLAVNLRKLVPSIEITAILGSVAEAMDYFGDRPKVDLIFSDIQLTDGVSFDIIKAVDVNAPIIFCTAYDQYAIEAFNANGIEYILKPFGIDSLKKALEKYEGLKAMLAGNIAKRYEALLASIPDRHNSTGTIIVRFHNKLLPLSFDKIAMLYVTADVTYLHTMVGENYILNETLEELEKITGASFIRANRQFLVSRKAIREAQDIFPRKLKLVLNIPFEREILISREKKTKVLSWLMLKPII